MFRYNKTYPLQGGASPPVYTGKVAFHKFAQERKRLLYYRYDTLETTAKQGGQSSNKN